MPDLNSIPIPAVVAIVLVLALLWRSQRVRHALANRMATPVTQRKHVGRDVALQAASLLGSEDLGLLWAQAVRREADSQLAQRFADDAKGNLAASYTSPFLPPAGPPQPAAPDHAQ
jgi:hypothetical protein